MNRDPIEEIGFKAEYWASVESWQLGTRDFLSFLQLGRSRSDGLYSFVANGPVSRVDFLGLAYPTCFFDRYNKVCFWRIMDCERWGPPYAQRCCKRHEACHILQWKNLVKAGKCPPCEYDPKTCFCRAPPSTGPMSVEKHCSGVRTWPDMECPCHWDTLRCLLDLARSRGMDDWLRHIIQSIYEKMLDGGCFEGDGDWVPY